MKKILLLFVSCFLSNLAFAQLNTEEEPASETKEIEADRPSKSYSSKIVPPGSVQLETGFLWKKDKTNFITAKELHYPETALRIGILKRAEIHFRGQLTHTRQSVTIENTMLAEQTGLEEIMAGTKINLVQNKGLQPEITFQADFRFPIDTKEFRGTKTEPKLRLAFTNKLSEKLSLQYNAGLEWEENEETENNQTFNHLALYTLGLNYKCTKKLTVFAEAFGEKPEEENYQQSLDGGFAYKVLSNLQLDLFGGFGLSEDAPDSFVSAGISFRIPK